MSAPNGNDFAKGNSGGGRPSEYRDEYAEQAYKLCLLGATDLKLADFFEVSERTINNWKSEHDEFFSCLKKGKIIADAEIAEGLYNRAKGAVINTQQAIKLKRVEYDQGKRMLEEERVEVVDLIQEVPPDTAAGIFWLKNRNPEMWRDKREYSENTDGNDEIEIRVVRVSKNKDAN